MCFGEPKLLTSSNYKIWVEHSAPDRMRGMSNEIEGPACC